MLRASVFIASAIVVTLIACSSGLGDSSSASRGNDGGPTTSSGGGDPGASGDAAAPRGDADVGDCPAGCGKNQICSAGVCTDLPATCPCPKDSYCDLNTNSCVAGCRDDDTTCSSGKICVSEQCRTGCRADGQCAATEYCDLVGLVCRTGCRGDTNCAANESCGQHACACKTGFGDCNGQTSDGCEKALPSCYVDADGDGYAAAAPTVGTCSGCPAGTVTTVAGPALDCDDTNPDVFPGQTKYFTTPYGAKNSYDYNCDGFGGEEYVYTVDSLHTVADTCNGGSACGPAQPAALWIPSMPTCGQTGYVYHCPAPGTPIKCVQLQQGCH